MAERQDFQRGDHGLSSEQQVTKPIMGGINHRAGRPSGIGDAGLRSFRAPNLDDTGRSAAVRKGAIDHGSSGDPAE